MLWILRTWKYQINVLLLLIAIGLEVFYSICGGSCSYLRGDIFGMNLTYVGIMFAVILIGLSLLKRDRLILVLLSAGVGVEIVLVAFQVRNHVYCPYCLAFAAVILLLFVLNFDVTKKRLIIVSVALGFVLFALFFKGSVTPTYAAEPTPSRRGYCQGATPHGLLLRSPQGGGARTGAHPQLKPSLDEGIYRQVTLRLFRTLCLGLDGRVELIGRLIGSRCHLNLCATGRSAEDPLGRSTRGA